MAPCDAKEIIRELEAQVRGLREALTRVNSIIAGSTARHCGLYMVYSIQLDTGIAEAISSALAASPAPAESESSALRKELSNLTSESSDQ